MVRTGGDKNASTPRWFKLAHAVVAARKSSGDSVADFMVDEDDIFIRKSTCTLHLAPPRESCFMSVRYVSNVCRSSVVELH